jgi:cob(I)alamin adenosyltransferase
VDLRDSGREVNPEVLRYLNRLADLLFVLARQAADAPEPRSRS